MDLGIVIVNYNVRDLLAACLDSVYLALAQTGSRLKASVVVVDNASRDGSVALLRQQFPRTPVLEADNRGMGAGNNRGLRLLLDQYRPFAVMVLNPDTLVGAGSLAALVDFLRAHPRAGVAAPKLLNPDGTLQHAAFHFPGLAQLAVDLFPPPSPFDRLLNSRLNGRYPASAYRAGQPFQVDHTLGAAFAVRSQAIQEVGLFDETFALYCEEIDWQWRLAHAGWERWIVPAAEVVHHGGQSTQQQPAQSLLQLWTSRRRLYQRYHGPVLNALAAPLVRLGMRQRIRANHRLSARGRLPADQRAAFNLALTEIIRIWQQRRIPHRELPAE